MKNSGKKQRQISSAREKLTDRLVGGSFSELANYSDLFRRTQDAIFLVDPDSFEILEANPAGAAALGLTAEAASGRSLPDFFETSEEARIETLSAGDRIDLSREGKTYECVIDRVRLADYCEVKQIILKDVSEIRRARLLLEKQSLTDEMTGLRNFRSFKSRLDLEFTRSRAKGIPFSVIFCDIDHFKHFNDKNGHPAGDEALRRVARALNEIAGATHFVARYGGEEFVVLCSNTNAQEAGIFAETIRTKIENTKIPFGENQPLGRVTLSLGVADSLAGQPDADAVLKTADDALYLSKKGGRNRVTVHAPAVLKKVA